MIRCAKDWPNLRAPPSLRGTEPKFTNSGRGAVIVVRQAAQALAPPDHAGVSKMARFWADESVDLWSEKSLSDLLHQAVFVIQATEQRRLRNAETRWQLVSMVAGRNFVL